MNESLKIIEEFFCDILFWLVVMFIGLCIADALFPEKKKDLKDYE